MHHLTLTVGPAVGPSSITDAMSAVQGNWGHIHVGKPGEECNQGMKTRERGKLKRNAKKRRNIQHAKKTHIKEIQNKQTGRSEPSEPPSKLK